MNNHIVHIWPDHCWVEVTINRSKCRLYSSEHYNLITILPVNSTIPNTESPARVWQLPDEEQMEHTHKTWFNLGFIMEEHNFVYNAIPSLLADTKWQMMNTSVPGSPTSRLDRMLLEGLLVEISKCLIFLHNSICYTGPLIHSPQFSWSVVSFFQVTFDPGGQRQSLNVVNSCVLTNHKAAQVL